jgi:hypothetical protein
LQEARGLALRNDADAEELLLAAVSQISGALWMLGVKLKGHGHAIIVVLKCSPAVQDRFQKRSDGLTPFEDVGEEDRPASVGVYVENRAFYTPL